jgi:RimJ/RimL family protein N-acetyltransferase
VRRLATNSDIEQVFEIYMHEVVVPYLSFDPMPIEDFRVVYQKLLQRGSFYIYESAGQIAGFYEALRYAGRAQHVACLGTLALNPKLHGRGIAKEMISDAIIKMRESGVKRIELFVETDNAHAIRFYNKLGFEIEGTLRKFYKRSTDKHYVDEHIMAILLD